MNNGKVVHAHCGMLFGRKKKKSEIMKFAGIVTGLEKILSNKVAQTPKAKAACSLSSEIPSSEY